MRSAPILTLAACAALLLAGCASETARDVGIDKIAPRKAEQSLSAGIRDYEKGDYRSAARNLQTALDADLLFARDKVTAHKYLAFIHCVSKEKQCRDEFRKALAIDPAFELSAAEAGHPMWGPVYRSVKAAAR